MVALILVLLIQSAFSIEESFKNTNVERVINLTGRYPVIATKFTIENLESKSLSKYYYAIPDESYSLLAHIHCHLEAEPQNLFKIELAESESCCGYKLLKILIRRGVPSKGTEKLVLEEIYANTLQPMPRKIGIYDP